MPYKYNALLKLNLQKQQDVPEPPEPVTVDDELSPTSTNPVQNKVITAKLSEMENDTRKKVSKFFNSIEELEVGEIGEYQGEPGGDFVPGYFYKRQDVASLDFEPSGISLNFTEQLRIRYAPGKYVYQYHSGDIYQDYNINYGMEARQTAGVFVSVLLLNKNFVAATNMQTYVYNNIEFYVYPYGTIMQPDEPITGFAPDFDNPLQVVNNKIYYKNTALYFNNEQLSIRIFWGISKENPHIKYCWVQNYGCYIPFICDYNVISVIYSPTISDLPIAHDAEVISVVPITIDFHDYTFTENAPFLRVDTQPALDPSNFATAAQGAKADSALQSISKGTDGNYITTTVTPKDANKQQKVSASLTIQDITAAAADHRGLLEALNTRNYIDTQIYNVSLNFFFYGVQWDENNPSPDCTRIGNMSLHAELPIQNGIIGGLLADDLTFTPFPDQSDWSGETVDGSAGQLMLQIPKHYFKSEVVNGIHKKLISQYPLAGFIEIPLMYVSAEKATVDRTDPTTPKLCSVVNSSPEYRGGQNNADWDNTYRTLLGKPATNISLTDFRQYARNRGNGTAWNCHTYQMQRVLYWLFVTEYATLNSKKAFNAAKDANGYMQGGLGPGVSDWNSDAWMAYNTHNPLIPCGYLLEYGNQSAVKNYSVKDADGNTLHTFSVNSYRGIQSPFGDIWDWTDGILVNVESDAAGGVSTCYITDDPAKFSSSDFSQYTELGSTPRAQNWIKTIFDSEQGDIICKTQGGSSTSYYCDFYLGSNIPTSDVSLRSFRFGGTAYSGSRCGFLSATSHHVPATAISDFGSRLCAIPPSN